MTIYCSIDPYKVVEFASEPIWHPRDVYLCIPKYQIPQGVYRWVDSQGVYLGWMAIRIERAFTKLAAGQAVDLDRLHDAIAVFYAARGASGVAPCEPGGIPAGYGPPAIPAAAGEAAERIAEGHHWAGAGRVEGGAGVVDGTEWQVGRQFDGGRAWQAGFDRAARGML